MDTAQTFAALLELGIDFRGHDEQALLYHACKTNPYSVTTGLDEGGNPYATTRRCTAAWKDLHGVEHPAVDRSAFRVYGESPGHAAALLLLAQLRQYQHPKGALNWKYAAADKYTTITQ